jgi:signal transduction histidine kinase
VHVAGYASKSGVSVVVLNDIESQADQLSGVPDALQNAVFEPFFRLRNVMDERFRQEELGMGMGLTIVQSTVQHFGGTAYVYEVLDHVSGATPRRRVAAELNLRVC